MTERDRSMEFYSFQGTVQNANRSLEEVRILSIKAFSASI